MIGSFLHFVLNGLIDVMIWAIIISAIMSWLTAFNVVNLRNGFVAGGADQPVPWSCTAADSCTRLGTIDNTQPMTAISQLAPAA